MRPFKIEMNCDEWWLADSLREIANEVENTSIMDGIETDGKVEIHGDHYDAVITRENNDEDAENW